MPSGTKKFVELINRTNKVYTERHKLTYSGCHIYLLKYYYKA